MSRMLSTLLAVPLLALVVPAGARAHDPGVDQRRTIVVTGQAEVKGKPDRVVVSFAVETVHERAAEAAADNAKRSAAVAEAVKRLLGPDDTVATTRYTVEPRYEQPRPGEPREPRITGYVVRNELEVTSGRTDRVGALVDAAMAAGANRIEGLHFTLAQRDDFLRRAVEQAGLDARAQAESVARGLGVRVKAVLAATTSALVPMPPRRFDRMEVAAMRAPTPIEAGEATVGATVQVTFEIE